MKRPALAIALIAATTACSAHRTGPVSIRSLDSRPAALASNGSLDRGDLLFSRGEYALALDAYRKAVRSNGSDAHALNGVAISYAAMGRHDLAREYFELALARAPLDQRIYRNFARSLEAQGLNGEARQLMAQAGSASPVLPGAARPTLAQLAASAPRNSGADAARTAGLELERVSLGEVRLLTMASPTPDVPAGRRMASRLTTRIVTVTDTRAAMPMARELKAPIIAVGTVPAGQPKPAIAVAQGTNVEVRETSVAQTVATRPVAFAKEPTADSATLAECGKARRGSKSRFRLPATGSSIDLPAAGKGANADGQCASWAGKDARDGLFERLWKGWLHGQAWKKDVAG